MSRHYIRVDEYSRIIKGFSEEFEEPQKDDICINENGGRHFEMLGQINPALVDIDFTYIYRYENGQILEKTKEEVTKDL